MKSLKGYPGNDRADHTDLNLMSVSLQHRTKTQQIGMNEKQVLSCKSQRTVGVDKFTMQFFNATFDVSMDITVANFQTLMNTELAAFGSYVVSVTGATNLCQASPAYLNVILFTTPTGATLPLLKAVNVIGAEAEVFISPSIDAVDSRSIVASKDGYYSIIYTPTIAGSYDLAVQIGLADVSNDLVNGILVTPALEYAATSTHNISQVNREGVREYFVVQLRDEFGNELISPLSETSELMVSMVGKSAQCQSDANSSDDVQIPIEVLYREPYTDGIYTMQYDPTFAGSYDISVKLATRGGLLATYYKDANHSSPVLASLGNLHDGAYHKPYWCDGLQVGNFSTAWTFAPGGITFCDQTIKNCGCDSTRLDTSLDFNWKTGTPLPFDEPYSGKFPNDFFSVKWEGFVTSPMTGMYTITLKADYGVQMWVNGVQRVNAVPMSQESVSFTVNFAAYERNSIIISYYHNTDDAFFSATWGGPGVVAGTVLDGQHLSYAREIVNSPITVEVYPGDVDASTSSASGSGLT
jgi:hypothetical protein